MENLGASSMSSSCSSSCSVTGDCVAADAELSQALGVLAKETEDFRLFPESANETRERRFRAFSDSDGEIESVERVERRLSEEPKVRRCLLASNPPDGESPSSLVSEGLSRSDEAAEAAELRAALERATELRSEELRADEAGVAEVRDWADSDLWLLAMVDAGVQLSSLTPPSAPSTSLLSTIWVSVLVSTERLSANESALSPLSESKRWESIEPSGAEESEATLRRVLCSSASQNSLSLSSPKSSLGTSLLTRTPVRRPRRTTISRDANEASFFCSVSSVSEDTCCAEGKGAIAATTRLRNSTGRIVIWRPVPARLGVVRLHPICRAEAHPGASGAKLTWHRIESPWRGARPAGCCNAMKAHL